MKPLHEYHHLILETGLLGDMIKEAWRKIGYHRILADLDKSPLCVWCVGQFPGHTHQGQATYWPPMEAVLWEQRADMIIPIQFPSTDAPGGDGPDYALLPNEAAEAARKDLLPHLASLTSGNKDETSIHWYHTVMEIIWEMNAQSGKAFPNGHEFHIAFEGQAPKRTEGIFLSPFWHSEYRRAVRLVGGKPLLLCQVKHSEDSRNPYRLSDWEVIFKNFLHAGWAVALCGDTDGEVAPLFETHRGEAVFNLGRFSLARTFAWALLASVRATTISSMMSFFTVFQSGNFVATHPQLPDDWRVAIQRRFILTPQSGDRSVAAVIDPGNVGDALCQWALSQPDRFNINRLPYETPGGVYLTANGIYRDWRSVFYG